MPQTLPLETALSSAPIGTLLLDENNVVIWANDTLSQLLGKGRTPTLGQPIDKYPDLAVALENKVPEIYVIDSTPRWLSISLSKDESSEVPITIIYLDDITALKQSQQKIHELELSLQQEITQDPETGLLNRRGLLQILAPLVSKSRRYETPLSIIKIKISGIEHHNQEEKQQIFSTLSHFLKDQLRWADLVSYLGDNAFYIALPETQENAAATLAEKIVQQIEHLKNDETAKKIHLRAQSGVTSWSKGADANMLLESAAAALR